MEKKKLLAVFVISILVVLPAVFADCSGTKAVGDICQQGKFKDSGSEKDAYAKYAMVDGKLKGRWFSDNSATTPLPQNTVLKDTSDKTPSYYVIGASDKGGGVAWGEKSSGYTTADLTTAYNSGTVSSSTKSTTSSPPPSSPSSGKPTTPPPKKGTMEKQKGLAESEKVESTKCNACEVIEGIMIPNSEKDKFYDGKGNWLVEEDENGNLAAKDGLAVYSKDGTIKIDNQGKQYTLDNTNGQYSPQKGILLPTAVGGAISSLGGQVVAPLNNGGYAVGGVTIDKKTYETLQSSAGGKQLSIDTLPGDHSVSWGDNTLGGSIVQKAGITSITLKQDNKEETKWSLPDGTVLKAKDGWKEDSTSGTLNNNKEGKTVKVDVADDLTTITKTEGKEYFKAETIIKKNGDSEVKKYEGGKLRSYTGTEGELTFEAEIDSEGKVSYVEYKDEEGQRKKMVFDTNNDYQIGNGDQAYTFEEKNGELRVCKTNTCKTEKEAEKEGGEWKEAFDLKSREILSTWTNIMGGLLTVSEATRQYRGISALFKDAFDIEWQTGADKYFASWVGERWFSSAICENYYDKTPQGSAFVEDTFGNKRPVASIQAERSQSTSTLLCDENNACPEDFQCKKGLCYATGAKEPQQVYIYKISWGVTSPSDLELTPFKDEEGNAISFNIKIGENWIYERDGITTGAIRLKSGANDRDFTAHYSLNPSISQVCILWDPPPISKKSFGEEEELDDVCNDVDISSLEVLDFGGAKSSGSASASVSGGEVKPISGFLK